LPVTVDARNNRFLISPFYVVHYGILNSESARIKSYSSEHWNSDPSLEAWNVAPENISVEQFKINADWVVDNIKNYNSKHHLLYEFSWAYSGYPNGGLTPPWWSGLTDSYALILLLRAYDVFKDEKYIEAANKLYKSVLSPIEAGGSVNKIENSIWIEEYVDPRAPPNEMSRVLNGMVYSFKGISAYESANNIKDGKSTDLRGSIQKNAIKFNRGFWSDYDLLGNQANLKYHKIHVRLLRNGDIINDDLMIIAEKWAVGERLPIIFWLLSGSLTISKIHFIALLLFALLFPTLVCYKSIRR
jgi:hypothetical protein